MLLGNLAGNAERRCFSCAGPDLNTRYSIRRAE
jgi:hypothetical protein